MAIDYAFDVTWSKYSCITVARFVYFMIVVVNVLFIFKKVFSFRFTCGHVYVYVCIPLQRFRLH